MFGFRDFEDCKKIFGVSKIDGKLTFWGLRF